MTEMPLSSARRVYAAAYLAAVAAGVAVATLAPISSLWWRSIAAGATATLLLYACSYRWDNSAFYDVYWSIAPVLFGAYWAAVGAPASRPRALLAAALTAAWGLRLTYNWWTNWHGLGREDWRYADLRSKTSDRYWVASFFALHVYPLLMVTLGSLPLYVAAADGERELSWLDGVAALVMVAAVTIEASADAQLHRFVRDRSHGRPFLDTGLWASSRHPNYFGEALVWWGIYLFALAADPGAWWTCLGALGVTAMITLISIPMADRRQAAKRHGFVDYIRATSAFVPLPPKPREQSTRDDDRQGEENQPSSAQRQDDRQAPSER